MKMKTVLLIMTCVLFALSVSAQESEMFKKELEQIERGRKTKAALDEIAEMSPTFSALRKEPSLMIIEAAKSNDAALIPLLKIIASDTKWRIFSGRSEFQAHIALAKLGDKTALDEILCELENVPYLIRFGAIAKLAQIGSKEINRKLYELLDDNRIIDDGYRGRDEIRLRNFQMVMEELGKIYDDSPKRPNGVVSYDVAAWKAWFKSKKLIE